MEISLLGGWRAGVTLLFVLMFGFTFRSVATVLTGSNYTIVERENKKGIVNKRGQVVVPVQYEDLGWSDREEQLLGDVIGYKKGGLWGLINLKNERVASPAYTVLIPYNDHLIIAARKRSYNKEIVYGLINTKGRPQLEFKYYRLEKNGDRLIATVKDGNEFKTGLIDERSKVYIPMSYRWVRPLTPDVYAVADTNKKIAFFSAVGTRICEFELDSIQALNDRYELVYHNGKTGIFDKTTQKLIRPEYRQIEVDEKGGIRGLKFREWMITDSANHILNVFNYDRVEPVGKGLYKVAIGGAQALIDESDHNLTGFKKIEIGNVVGSAAFFKEDHRYGVVSLGGKTVLEPVYDTIIAWQDYFLAKGPVESKYGWVLYKDTGKRLTAKVYEEMQPVGSRYFAVKSGGYWGAVNGLGEEVLFCKYDRVAKYLNGRFKVNLLGEDGIIGLHGDWVVLPMKKEIDMLDDEHYLVRSPYGSYVARYPKTILFSAEYFLYPRNELYLEKTRDGKIGLLDARGQRIIPPVYDEISKLEEDSLYITRAGTDYSFITKHGQMVDRLDQRYQEVREMSDYFIGVKIDGRWGFVDINGNLRVANRYEGIGPYHEDMAPIKLRGKWGFIDKLELLKVQPLYDTVYPFRNGLARVQYKGNFGMVDKHGKRVLDFEYDDILALETGGYITVKDGKKGLVNQDGHVLIWPKFDKVVDLNNKYVIVVRRGRYGLMSTEGLSPIPTLYDEIIYDPWKREYLVARPAEWKNLRF